MVNASVSKSIEQISKIIDEINTLHMFGYSSKRNTYVNCIRIEFSTLDYYKSLIETNTHVYECVQNTINKCFEPDFLLSVEKAHSFKDSITNAKTITADFLTRTNLEHDDFMNICGIFENVIYRIDQCVEQLKIFEELRDDFETKMFELFACSKPNFWSVIRDKFSLRTWSEIHMDDLRNYDIIEKLHVVPDHLADLYIGSTNQWVIRKSDSQNEVLVQLSLNTLVFSVVNPNQR